MNKLLRVVLSFVLCVFGSIQGWSQSISSINTDASKYPKISTTLRIIGADNKFLQSLKAADLLVKESGTECSVSSVNVPLPAETLFPVSFVVAFDASNSMLLGAPDMSLQAHGALTLIENLSKTGSNCALLSYAERTLIHQDYTKNQEQLIRSVESILPRGGSKLSSLFNDDKTNVFSIVEKAPHRSVLVLMNDASAYSIDESTIRAIRDKRIIVYALEFKQQCPKVVQELCGQTGGTFFENIKTKEEVSHAIYSVLSHLSGAREVTIEWEAVSTCESTQKVEISIPSLAVATSTTYTIPELKQTSLFVESFDVDFGKCAVGSTAKSFLQLSSIRGSYAITNIKRTGSPQFTTENITFPLRVAANESVQIPITYTPKDSSYTYSLFELQTDHCGILKASVHAGFPGAAPKEKYIRVLYPNGTEKLVANTLTTLKWDGVPATEFARVEYSVNGGASWNTITDSARGNSYQWQVPNVDFAACLLRVTYLQPNSVLTSNHNDVSDNPWSIIRFPLEFKDLSVGSCKVGSVKDTTFAVAKLPTNNAPVEVYGIKTEGINTSDFTIIYKPQQSIVKQGESYPIEVAFIPKGEGLREIFVRLETSAGSVMRRFTGYGVKQKLQEREDVIDCGAAVIGDSTETLVNDALQNSSSTPLTITRVFNAGPDKTQFQISLPKELPALLQPGEVFPVSILFKPTANGRTTTQFVFENDQQQRQSVLTAYAVGGEDAAPTMADVSNTRGILVPNAIAPKKGKVSIASYDVAGLVANFSPIDNLTIIGGGVLVPLANSVHAYSLGLKYTLDVMPQFKVAVGYQFASSVYNKEDTLNEVESDITSHVPYLALTYGNENLQFNSTIGYAIKRHVTPQSPNGFDANALFGTLSSNIRIAKRWKLNAEMLSGQEVGYVPIVLTARYLATKSAFDFGFAYVGFTTGTTEAPSIPIVPVLTATFTF